MQWQVRDSGKKSASWVMEYDQNHLVHESKPTLHFYEWKQPTITFGHFIDPWKWLKKEAVQQENLDIAKRPTGGGILFHLTDFSFSLFIPRSHPHCSPNTLENYAFIYCSSNGYRETTWCSTRR